MLKWFKRKIKRNTNIVGREVEDRREIDESIYELNTSEEFFKVFKIPQYADEELREKLVTSVSELLESFNNNLREISIQKTTTVISPTLRIEGFNSNFALRYESLIKFWVLLIYTKILEKSSFYRVEITRYNYFLKEPLYISSVDERYYFNNLKNLNFHLEKRKGRLKTDLQLINHQILEESIKLKIQRQDDIIFYNYYKKIRDWLLRVATGKEDINNILLIRFEKLNKESIDKIIEELDDCFKGLFFIYQSENDRHDEQVFFFSLKERNPGDISFNQYDQDQLSLNFD